LWARLAVNLKIARTGGAFVGLGEGWWFHDGMAEGGGGMLVVEVVQSLYVAF